MTIASNGGNQLGQMLDVNQGQDKIIYFFLVGETTTAVDHMRPFRITGLIPLL